MSARALCLSVAVAVAVAVSVSLSLSPFYIFFIADMRSTFSGTFNAVIIKSNHGSEGFSGPPAHHSWSKACGQISKEQAIAYTAGKKQVLAGLRKLYDPNGVLFIGKSYTMNTEHSSNVFNVF